MRNIDQMITDQVKIWTQHEEEAQLRGEVPGAWPIITISREVGARGAALAALLGQRMGFKVWDKELLQAIAEEGGGDVRLLKSLDEHRRKTIDDAMHGTLMGSKHTNTHYFRALIHAIHTIVAHGKSIVVGRGANYISKSPEILKVRVVCPLEARIRGYAERNGLTEKQARKEVVRRDADRADFIRHHFRRDVGTPSDYDLVLNACTLSLEQMADVVLAAYETKVGEKVPWDNG